MLKNSDKTFSDPFYKGTAQVGVSLPVGPSVTLRPSVLALMAIDNSFAMDYNVKAYIQEKLWFGVSYRDIQSMVALVGFNVNQLFGASYSYEMSTGDMKTFNDGRHDLVLTFRFNNFKRQGSSDMVKGVIVFLLLPGFVQAQTLVFKEVTKLSSAVNSDYEEAQPLLSPDGTTFYFTRFLSPSNKGGEYSGTDVWASRYDRNEKWTGGKRIIPKIENSSGNNAVIGISPKGDWLYASTPWRRVMCMGSISRRKRGGNT